MDYAFAGAVALVNKGGAVQPGVNSLLDAQFHSNYHESRPKTKFFSLLIYAGYPMQ